MNTFGDKIYYLRKNKQKTQTEVAIAVGTTKSTISKYERNLVEPTLESAKKLADYFTVSLDWLARNNDLSKTEPFIPTDYVEVVKNAINQKITPDNLTDILTLILKLRKKIC